MYYTGHTVEEPNSSGTTIDEEASSGTIIEEDAVEEAAGPSSLNQPVELAALNIPDMTPTEGQVKGKGKPQPRSNRQTPTSRVQTSSTLRPEQNPLNQSVAEAARNYPDLNLDNNANLASPPASSSRRDRGGYLEAAKPPSPRRQGELLDLAGKRPALRSPMGKKRK
jgi:hypothetical protein